MKKKVKIHRIQGISLDILKDNNAKVYHSQTAENKFKDDLEIFCRSKTVITEKAVITEIPKLSN